MKKIIKFIALAAGLASGLPALAAGDYVFEISPCTSYGTRTSAYTTYDKPMGAGEEIYFSLRLIDQTWGAQTGEKHYPWYPDVTSVGSTNVMLAMSPLRIGIYVSGKTSAGEVRFADLVGWSFETDTSGEATGFTDLFFKYTTQVGDFATPIRLALADTAGNPTPALGQSGDGVNYYLDPLTKANWQFSNDSTDPNTDHHLHDLAWCDTAARAAKEFDVVWGTNRTMEKCGFYVQTIGFDPVTFTDDIWRSIYKGSSKAEKAQPVRLATTVDNAKVTTAVSFYVWSLDESVFRVVSDDTATICPPKADGTMGTGIPNTHIGTVTFEGGSSTANFSLWGVECTNTAALVMSPYKGYTYATTGQIITNHIETVVQCTGPQPPHVEISCADDSVYAVSGYDKYQTTLSLKIEGNTLTGPLAVTVKPRFTDGTTGQISDYVRLSLTEVNELPDTTDLQVTFAAGETEKTIYVYPLCADSHTALRDAKIEFVPEVSAADKTTYGLQDSVSKSLLFYSKVGSDGGLVATAVEGTSISAKFNQPRSFPITVEDFHASVNNMTVGFRVRFYANASSDTYEDLGAFGVGAENRLYKLTTDTDGNVIGGFVNPLEPPKFKIATAGEHTTKFEIYAPTNFNYSTTRFYTIPVTVTVEEPNKVSLSFDDYETGAQDQTEYDEGDMAYVNISLKQSGHTSSIYAFLQLDDPTDLAKVTANRPFIVGMNNMKGLEIQAGETAPKNKAYITFLDGEGGAAGKEYGFSVVLTDVEDWDGTDTTHILGGYQYGSASVNVHNVAPTITGMSVNNNDETANGGTFSTKMPMGSEMTFKAIVEDAGEYDLVNTLSPFKTRWSISVNGESRDDLVTGAKVIEGDPNDDTKAFTYKFEEAGTWRIVASVMDKDMNNKYSPETWTVYVEVLDKPSVTLTRLPTLYENELSVLDHDPTNVTVSLDYFDPRFNNGTLWTAVKVKSNTNDNGNNGLFKLDHTHLWANMVDTSVFPIRDPGDQQPDADADYYLVKLSNSWRYGSKSETLSIEELDGVNGTFTMTAYVAFATDQNGNLYTGTLPSIGETATAAYLNTSSTVRVRNVEPVFAVVAPNENDSSSSNRWTTARTVSWTVDPYSDVANDFTKTLTVSFFVNGVQQDTTNITTVGTHRGTFTPTFGAETGDITVTLQIRDADNGMTEHNWYYNIPQAKFLTTLATGPSAGNSTVSESLRYARASGRGAGHVYTEVGAGNVTSAKNFRLTWSCAKTLTEVGIWGFGYRYDSEDNGTLNGSLDVAITQDGQLAEGTNPAYFKYSTWLAPKTDAEKKDSFFYAWIRSEASEGNASAGGTGGSGYTITIAPEFGKDIASGSVKLPTQASGDGVYATTYVEGVFSKEYLVRDELGDINQDGVPDYYAVKDDWANGCVIELATGLSRTEGDLQTLASYCPTSDGTADGTPDLLPNIFKPDNSFAVNTRDGYSYAPIGNPFTAPKKIRGFAEGLNEPNATIVTNAVPDLDDWEKAARKAWYEAAVADGTIDDTVYTSADTLPLDIWSPEPGAAQNKPDSSADVYHMDPTTNNTDGDRFSDAWEYYFWYTAHVWGPGGRIKPAGNQKYLFERYSWDLFQKGIVSHGEEIPYEDVKAYFHPLVALPEDLSGKLNNDFDQDGLSDYEEYLIGTNPCHWDTDGDHMCDTWEVLYGLDPVNGTQPDNTDGDYMAYWTTWTRYVVVRKVETTTTTDPNTGVTTISVTTNSNLSAATEEGAEIYVILDTLTSVPTSKDPIPDYETVVDRQTISVKRVMLKDKVVKMLKFSPKYVNGEIYRYGEKSDLPQIYTASTVWGFYMADDIEQVEFELKKGDELETFQSPENFVLVHDQVRDAFGYDPRTAWYANGSGCVGDRWISDGTGAGTAVNTRLYGAYDEYLVMGYRLAYDIFYPNEGRVIPFTQANLWNIIRSLSTNPTVAYTTTSDEDAETGESTETTTEETPTSVVAISEAVANAFAQAGSTKSVVKSHGADTDQDGIPDGWELYVCRNPNAVPGNAEDGENSGERDHDDDGLSFVREFAGTDTCDAYKSCETIYANHPGNLRGWWNKFFPTDPDANDTDQDGIKDGAEGESWTATFYHAGEAFADTSLTFIYGNPSDASITCIRGGGLNPCTIDTDRDGLPDPWERAYAGVVANAQTKTSDTGVTLSTATLLADGVYSNDFSSVTNELEYIAGGMDGTWNGDVCTYPNTGEEGGTTSFDMRLGVMRDVDFDHDGLQNWQEYVVQSLRHLRWDDISTPLMGRVMTEGEYNVGGWVETNIFYEVTASGTTNVLDVASIEAAEAQAQSGSAVGKYTWRYKVQGTHELDTDHTQAFKGYMVMDPADPEGMVDLAAEAWLPQDKLTWVLVTNDVTAVLEPDGSTNYVYQESWKHVYTVGSDPAFDVLMASITNEVETAIRHQPWTSDGWRNLGYFAPPPQTWDKGPSHLYMLPLTGRLDDSGRGYASTDPRRSDTDSDGLDDYYELFHGLNPILGSTSPGYLDVIADVYARPSTYNAYCNEWFYPKYNAYFGMRGISSRTGVSGAVTGPEALDPFLYPWVMGAPEVDADGDGLRNGDESIVANIADPLNTHTDPTPLWFTERTTPASYVNQYYRRFSNKASDKSLPWTFRTYISVVTVSGGTNWEGGAQRGANGASYNFAFEENEGYDTDNDFVPDGREAVTTITSATDPLRFDDPDRRQAMWFGGNSEPSYLIARDEVYRPIGASDLFKQFTVEAWVYPTELNRAQTIIDRPVAYDANTIDSDAFAYRSNFRIGITADNRLYGLFDNSDAKESGADEPTSCQTALGPVIDKDTWYHVALTFDGEDLKIYVNGSIRKTESTHLIPANGVVKVLQNPANTGLFPSYSYSVNTTRLLIGARPKKGVKGALDVYDGNENFDNLQEYFQGWIDEVRIWDGARTGEEINENYRTRFSFEEVSANRDSVYDVWRDGGTRNNNDGKPTLPPELVMHYNFKSVPGAPEAALVAPEPSGFSSAILGKAQSDYTSGQISSGYLADGYPNLLELKGMTDGTITNGLACGWWASSKVRSQVYTNECYVPWIQNTVQHLPPLDGSALDTFIHADYIGAQYVPASDHNVERYAFPNTAMPYTDFSYGLERYYRLKSYGALADNLNLDAYEKQLRYMIQSGFIGTSDLVPMGKAYAKSIAKMWDDSPSDLWEYTGADSDGDGLPDAWEAYAAANYGAGASLAWNATVDYNGRPLSAAQAYKLDLARGWQADGIFHAELASTIDENNNNIPDWWERFFGVENCDADGDDDDDGLTNYEEYLVSFGATPYGLVNGYPMLDPKNARSLRNQIVTDYFLPGGTNDVPAQVTAGEYLGEIVGDHDFMEAWWEKQYHNNYANAYVYDPDLDSDGDGWSNFAEARTCTWRGSYTADVIDRYLDNNADNHLKCYPQPAIGIKATYFGVQDVSGHGLVVRAGTAANKRTDSTFLAKLSSQDEQKTRRAQLLGGYYGATTLHGFIHPGNLVPSEVEFSMAKLSSDRTYYWKIGPDHWGQYSYHSGSYEAFRRARMVYGNQFSAVSDPEITFDTLAKTVSNADGSMGDIILSVSNVTASVVIGTINYRTGEYDLDLNKVISAGVALDGMMFRADYYYRLGDEWPQTIWVSDAEIGRVREGINTVEAFIDLNENGTYDIGEPYGMAKNVNIGWHKTNLLTIELKDESKIVARSAISAAVAADDEDAEDAAEAPLTAQVIIRRTSINGFSEIGDKAVPVRTAASRTLVLDERPYLTEADVLASDVLDLDWRWLARDAAKLLPQKSSLLKAGYDIEQVVTLEDGTTTNVVLKSFTRMFLSSRTKPVALAPASDEPVYAAQPTFTFSSSDETMTAYRLQVATSNKADAVIWDSGAILLPGRASYTPGTATYKVTPELYADCCVTTNGSPIFANATNYYWRVALLNAKFNEVDESSWCDWAAFQMDSANEKRHPQMLTGYGNAAAAVRYYGPGKYQNLTNIVVEAFANADFTGLPLARVRIGDDTIVSNITDIVTTNAVLHGIEPGKVYLRAYIDSNNNGKRDTWESWGYANHVGASVASIYTPKSLTVTEKIAAYPSLTIYIEDCDTNRNEIPDIWEYDNNKDFGASGESASDDSDGDGLKDVEEPDYGTDPSLWDTDGDGMPDGWEAVFAELDPLFNDADEVTEGDVMAYARVDCVFVTLDDGSKYVLEEGEDTPHEGDTASDYRYRKTYPYGNETGLGAGVAAADVAGRTVLTVSEGKIVLVHAQVYDAFGFNPQTANPAVGTNDWVNTKAFTALDKYLVVRYLEALGLANEVQMNLKGQWSQYTLKPGEADMNIDGIPDGWELYVMFGPYYGSASMPAKLADAAISPWGAAADVRNIAKTPGNSGLTVLQEYDRGNTPTDPWKADTNGDGVIDKYAYRYHLKSSTMAAQDNDGDGLSNYAEYLISEVFKAATLDPDNAKTDGGTLDYFRKFGQMYLGEIFADHDQVDDAWEADYETGNNAGVNYASRGVYDPELDLDGDGWSNYAEAKAGTNPMRDASAGIEDFKIIEHPVPVVEMNVGYNGPSTIKGALTFKAWNQARDPFALGSPDAVWTVAKSGEDTVAVSTKYLDLHPKGKHTYYLGPGAVKQGSFRLFAKDTSFVKGVLALDYYGEQVFQPTEVGRTEEANWYYFVIDRNGVLYTIGGELADEVAVGTIDYQTGKATIDFDNEALAGYQLGDSKYAETDSSGKENEVTYDLINLDKSYIKLAWEVATTGSSATGMYYLSDPTDGALREGPTTFTVEFESSGADVDTDSTSTSTAHPFGVVRDVDVGWAGARATVELTDFSPITPRIDLWKDSSDRTETNVGIVSNLYARMRVRNENWNDYSNNVEVASADGAISRVRVVRYAINGWPTSMWTGEAPSRTVLDRNYYADGRTTLSELDFLYDRDGMLELNTLDIDALYLHEDIVDEDGRIRSTYASIAGNTLTNVAYLVVFGDGKASWERLSDPDTVYAHKALITRRFDATRATAVADAMPATLYGARPTFTWHLEGESDWVKTYGSSYVAFRLQVRQGSTEVWDSGVLRAPARNTDGSYTWTAPVCAGSITSLGQGFDATGGYTWRVTMMNAKFTEPAWSNDSAFRTAVNAAQEVNDNGHSSIKVAVKYAGPASVLGKHTDLTTAQGKVRVQAFATPDFAGEPLAETIAASGLTDALDSTPNATLRGLSADGTYYVRAYIDMNGNCVKDDFESWGSGGEVVLSTSLDAAPVVGVWIEDADTDGDWLPDAWEFAENGWSGNWSDVSTKKSTTVDGVNVVTLPFSLASAEFDAGISTGLPGASLTVFQSSGFAAALLGLDTANRTTIEAIRAAVNAKVQPNSVKITAITFDRANSRVLLTVDAEVASNIAGDTITRYYGLDTATVTVNVYKKTSLAEAGWGDPIKSEVVTLGAASATVPVDLAGLDTSSGFFKVEVVQ